MTSTLSERAALAEAQGFRVRVQAQMTATAVSIISFAQGSMGLETWQKRMALADQVIQNAPSWLSRFSWAVAGQSPVIGDIHSPVAITGTTAGLPAVITTDVPHGIATNDIVFITGTDDAAVGGTFLATAIDTLKVSVPVLGVKFGADGGTICEQPTDLAIASAIETAWNALAGVTAETT